VLAKAVFWGSLGALAWTHAGYGLAMSALARIRPRPVAREEITPSVALVVSAHDEEAVIVRRLENLLALDYPADRLRIVVASDGSTDRTDELVAEVAAREPRVSLLPCPREGKVAAQHRAVRETASDVVAFTDANTEWRPDALRTLVRNLADPTVGYVCGQLRLESANGANQEGLYWRYEVWVREQESRAGNQQDRPRPHRHVDPLCLADRDLQRTQCGVVGLPGVAESAVHQAEDASDEQDNRDHRTARTVTRTGIGAAIGAVAGGGKGAAIGAAVGAGAGAGSVFIQGSNDLELMNGTEFRIRARTRQ